MIQKTIEYKFILLGFETLSHLQTRHKSLEYKFILLGFETK